MKAMRIMFGTGLLVAAMSVAVADERVPVSELPDAVRKAVEAKLPGGEITRAEWDDRRRGYELHVTHEGKTYEVEVTREGELQELELESR